MLIKLENLRIRVNEIPPETTNIDQQLKQFIASKLSIPELQLLDYTILHKSTDSRRGAPTLIYTIVANIVDESAPVTGEKIDKSRLIHPATFKLPESPPPGLKNPIIVGTGPAGLMAAYLLSAAGCNPIIIERGYDVDRRQCDIARFRSNREFNPDSNYLIGEGGAGTFSDGKLYTRTGDERTKLVLQLLVAAGAPEEIQFLKRPHIGSDLLPSVVRGIRKNIETLGGCFKYEVNITDLIIKNAKCRGVITTAGEKLEAPVVIIAHGLGGRELTTNLLQRQLQFALKGFQIGCRIEHEQQLIDRNQYRVNIRPPFLDAAEYHLSHRAPTRAGLPGVSTFCMCPGGEIVPIATGVDRLSTNGMSCYARNGKFANSCIIATVPPEKFTDPAATYHWLAELERQTFKLGGGDYVAPAQDAAAFIRGERGLRQKNATGYCFGLRSARVDQLLPKPLSEAIAVALRHFEKIFPGFSTTGTMIGVETGVSSPIRFIRHPDTLATSIDNLYMAGESAGYAGGIISAAVDGLRIAGKLLTTNR